MLIKRKLWEIHTQQKKDICRRSALGVKQKCLLNFFLMIALITLMQPVYALQVKKTEKPEAPRLNISDILVGAVSSLSGPVAFPESTDAVQAYFDVVNASGGVHGRKLKLIVADDGGSSVTASQVARKLLNTNRVVAMVGGASIVDCATNAETYLLSGVMAIQGTGVESNCFSAENISPVNTGPYLSVYTALEFAVKNLARKRPCVLILNLGAVKTFEKVIDKWTTRSGQPQPISIVFNPGDAELPLMHRVIEEKCDSVIHTGVESMAIDWVIKSKQLGIVHALPHIFLTPAYTQQVAQTLVSTKMPIYVMSEFEPWSSRSGSLSDWRAVMRGAKVPLSSFSQGGYTAAQIFVRILCDIQGDITRASITEAFKKMGAINLPMLGTPYSVGAEKHHNANRAALPLKLTEGVWRIAHHAWILVPE
jgi:branched-chain amino acid transport system substrate-binding protein